MSDFTPKEFAQNSTNAFADTVAATLPTIPVAIGDLVVVWVGWSVNGLTASISDGGSTFTPHSVSNVGAWSDAHGQFFSAISAVAGLVTYTATVTGAFGPHIQVQVFDVSSVPTFVADIATAALGGAGSTAPDSGALATTGTDVLVVGAYLAENSPNFDAATIGAVDAYATAHQVGSGAFRAGFWHDTTPSPGTVHAIATLSSAQKWLCNAIAFKIDSAAILHPQICLG